MGFMQALERTFDGCVPALAELVVTVSPARPCEAHMVHTVTVQTRGEAPLIRRSVVRRYTEFREALRVILARGAELVYPALPPVPGKEGLLRFCPARRAAFLEQRRTDLEHCLNAVLQHPELASMSEFLGLLGLSGGGGYLGVADVEAADARLLRSLVSSDGSDCESACQSEMSDSSGVVARLTAGAEAQRSYVVLDRQEIALRKKQTDAGRRAQRVNLKGATVTALSRTALFVDGVRPVLAVVPPNEDIGKWLEDIAFAIEDDAMDSPGVASVFARPVAFG